MSEDVFKPDTFGAVHDALVYAYERSNEDDYFWVVAEGMSNTDIYYFAAPYEELPGRHLWVPPTRLKAVFQRGRRLKERQRNA